MKWLLHALLVSLVSSECLDAVECHDPAICSSFFVPSNCCAYPQDLEYDSKLFIANPCGKTKPASLGGITILSPNRSFFIYNTFAEAHVSTFFQCGVPSTFNGLHMEEPLPCFSTPLDTTDPKYLLIGGGIGIHCHDPRGCSLLYKVSWTCNGDFSSIFSTSDKKAIVVATIAALTGTGILAVVIAIFKCHTGVWKIAFEIESDRFDDLKKTRKTTKDKKKENTKENVDVVTSIANVVRFDTDYPEVITKSTNN